ncbi:MAG: aminoglycoside phosphotransferase family protein [Anaerolineae bacterium]|nr:aminoglycoside phosphotransferase family protein [Anaerolineae bacterium]
MHEGEVHSDEALVKRLISAQFPQWADLPILRVRSAGTDNALYRLGQEMVVRLPRIDWAIGQIEKEIHWLPKLAPSVPFAIPVPLVKGKPGEGYPWEWAVYQWLEGESASSENISDLSQMAMDVARFITILQSINTTDAPLAVEHGLRGAPLSTRDEDTREAISALKDKIDSTLAIKIWEEAIQAPEWDKEPVWFHGDLLPGNLLVKNGRLHAVIDFNGLGAGDPACDLMLAWALFSGESREMFRNALGVDAATWARGRGHALSQAVIFIPYYWNTNPIGVANAMRTVNEILVEYQ